MSVFVVGSGSLLSSAWKTRFPPTTISRQIDANRIAGKLARTDLSYAERSGQESLEYARSGTRGRWQNPETGNAGTITPTRHLSDCGLHLLPRVRADGDRGGRHRPRPRHRLPATGRQLAPGALGLFLVSAAPAKEMRGLAAVALVELDSIYSSHHAKRTVGIYLYGLEGYSY